MRTCFVPFCDSKNKDQPTRTMFLVPKQQKLFAQWVDVLPKVRTLRSTDRVCYLHFRPEDIDYTFDHIIGGQILKIQRDRPRLKPDALPCLEMTSKDDLLLYRVKNRLPHESKEIKIIENTISPEVYEIITEDQTETYENETNNEIQITSQEPQEDVSNIVVNLEDCIENLTTLPEEASNIENFSDVIDMVLEGDTCEQIETPYSLKTDLINEDLTAEKLQNLFNLFYDNVYNVLVPNTLWGIHRCPNRSVICFSYMDALKLKITKIVSIHKDGSLQLVYDGLLIRSLKLTEDIDDLDSLSMVLNQFDMWRLCFGKSSNPECEVIVEPSDDNCWSNNDSEQLFLCKLCLQFSKEMR